MTEYARVTIYGDGRLLGESSGYAEDVGDDAAREVDAAVSDGQTNEIVVRVERWEE